MSTWIPDLTDLDRPSAARVYDYSSVVGGIARFRAGLEGHVVRFTVPAEKDGSFILCGTVADR